MSALRKKPKPSGRISSVPEQVKLSPCFIICRTMANTRSCLRKRLAFSMPCSSAISKSLEMCSVCSSETCMIFDSCIGKEWDSEDRGRLKRMVYGMYGDF